MRYRGLMVAAAVLSASLAAHADTQTFTITFTSGLSTATATVTGITDPYNSSAYDLTSGTGTLNGQTLTLVPVGPGTDSAHFYTNPSLGLFYDNVLYPSGPTLVDDAGLAFTDGTLTYNPFFDANGTYSGSIGYRLDTEVNATKSNTYTPTAVTVTQTPEPSSIALLGTGMLGVGCLIRKRFV